MTTADCDREISLSRSTVQRLDQEMTALTSLRERTHRRLSLLDAFLDGVLADDHAKAT